MTRVEIFSFCALVVCFVVFFRGGVFFKYDVHRLTPFFRYADIRKNGK